MFSNTYMLFLFKMWHYLVDKHDVIPEHLMYVHINSRFNTTYYCKLYVCEFLYRDVNLIHMRKLIETCVDP